MPLGQRRHERLAVQLERLETLQLDRQSENAQIQLAGSELLEHRRGPILVQMQHQPRQRALDRTRHVRQQIRPDRRQQRHAQRPCERIAVRARKRADLVARLDDQPGALDDLPARLGQRHVARPALDQLHPE